MKKWITEIQELSKQHGARLHPQAIVDFARDPATALHTKFEWDDGKASEAYRVWQARKLIVSVTIEHPKSNDPVQAFVSLLPDRQAGGGYRDIKEVLKNKNRNRELYEAALSELRIFRRKYESVAKLTGLLGHIDSVLTEAKTETAKAI